MSNTSINKTLSNPLYEIQFILKIEEIGLDKLELGFISGYQVLIPKSKYKVSDQVIFIHNDVLVDTNHEIFDFLAPIAKKSKSEDGWYLIQTIKIKGKFSDGVVLPLDILTKYNLTLETLPIKKYSKPFEQSIARSEYIKSNNETTYIPEFLDLRPGNFPTRLISKTDELNIKTYIDYFEELSKHDCYYTVKLDGSSMTMIYNLEPNKFTICSRNLFLNQSDNAMVKYAIKLIQEQNLVEKFEEIIKSELIENPYPNPNSNTKFMICVQGEFVGPKINGNRMQLSFDDFYMFSVKFIKPLSQGYFLGYEKLIEFSNFTGIKMVPILNLSSEESSSLDNIKTFCSQLKYTQIKQKNDKIFTNPSYAEGIVIRPKEVVFSEKLPQEFLSFKLINDNYKINPNQSNQSNQYS